MLERFDGKSDSFQVDGKNGNGGRRVGKINGKEKGRREALRVLVEYEDSVIGRGKNHPRRIRRNSSPSHNRRHCGLSYGEYGL